MDATFNKTNKEIVMENNQEKNGQTGTDKNQPGRTGDAGQGGKQGQGDKSQGQKSGGDAGRQSPNSPQPGNSR